MRSCAEEIARPWSHRNRHALWGPSIVGYGSHRSRTRLRHAAKVPLGDRGPVWWHDGAQDFNRQLINNTPYQQWYETRVQRDSNTG